MLVFFERAVFKLASDQEYRNAIAAVKAGTASSNQIHLAETMAKNASFLGSSPLASEARQALEYLGKKRK